MRIYIGEPGGFIWVWKGEPGFNDTVVDLKKVITMPREELKQSHGDVMWQLEDMGLIEESSEHAKWRERLHKRKAGQLTIEPIIN